jgi:hypothetical protein
LDEEVIGAEKVRNEGGRFVDEFITDEANHEKDTNFRKRSIIDLASIVLSLSKIRS